MKFKRKDFFTIVLAFLGLSSFGLIYKNNFRNDNDDNNAKIIKGIKNSYSKEDIKEEKNENLSKIFVYIDGEINKPGLYEMNFNDRIKHLVDKAGGFTKNADLSKINLALKLKDEMKVHILKIAEVKNAETKEYENESKNGIRNVLININTAEKDELMKITGIGETKADQIIKYREKNRFNKIEDIIKVNGIGKKTFEKIKNEITVD